MSPLDYYFLFITFVLGTIFGSFLDCACNRYIAGENWIKGHSHCDSCGHELKSIDLIPIISFLSTKGKCRYCGAKIDNECLYAELIEGTLFVLTYLLTGSISLRLLINLSFVVVFSAITLIDAKSMIIPDGLVLSLIAIYIVKLIAYWDAKQFKLGLLTAVGLGVFLLVVSAIMDKVLGQDSFGGGDIKLLFAVCLNFSPIQALLMLITCTILGLIYMSISRNRKIPFGPFICIASLIFLYYGNQIAQIYMGLM